MRLCAPSALCVLALRTLVEWIQDSQCHSKSGDNGSITLSQRGFEDVLETFPPSAG